MPRKVTHSADDTLRFWPPDLSDLQSLDGSDVLAGHVRVRFGVYSVEFDYNPLPDDGCLPEAIDPRYLVSGCSIRSGPWRIRTGNADLPDF